MKFLDYISDAQTNLRRAKLRTGLTVTALIIGTFTLAMTTAFTQGISAYLNTQLHAYGQADVINVRASSQSVPTSSAGVPEYQPSHQATQTGGGHFGSDKAVVINLSPSDIATVKSISGVKNAYAAYSDLSVNYVQQDNSRKYVLQVAPYVPGESTALAAGAFPDNAAGIVLPFPYVQTLGYSTPADLVGKTVTLNISNAAGAAKDYKVPVTGVLPDTVHQPGALLDYGTVTNMVKYQAGSSSSFSGIIAVTNPGVDKAGRASIKLALQAKGYDAMTYDDQLAAFSKPLQIVSLGLGGFAGIALLAAMIGIVNTLLMAVYERIQEIGLLKAMGMRRRGIFFQFLIEAASIGFWGGVIGVVLAQVLGRIANPILLRSVFAGFPGKQILSYPASYMIGIIALATLIGLIAGAFPAWRASRLSPIDALRRE